MIDIHTHILPYIDDGAKDINESLKMMEYLYQQQVFTAVCTPHFDPTQNTMDEFLQLRNKSMNIVNPSKINLITGSETMLHDFLFHISDITQLCINNSKYLLLEFPYKEVWSVNDYQLIERLIRYYNIIPVIAHVERYEPVRKNKKCIKKLIELGSVIQLNTESIMNKKSRRKTLQYIKKGWVDVLGSDGHNMIDRLPNMVEAFGIIEEELGIEYCQELQHKAECIINGIQFRKNSVQFRL